MPGLRVLLSSTAVALTCAVAGCGSSPARPDPTPLEPLQAQVQGREVWKASLGDSITFPLAIAVNGDTFTVAGDDGEVLALQAGTGRVLWRAKVGSKLSAGVGSDGRFASVVTRENELVTFDAGKPAWRKPLGSRVVTAPLVAGERVFVLGVDRSVQAFDALDGRRLWAYQHSAEALTLAQPGVLIPFKDTLLAGQGPKLIGLDPLNGTPRWETVLASPRGTNEVERLADLVAPAIRSGDAVCARAFHAAVACINAERGALSWTRPAGGPGGLGMDGPVIAGIDATDRLTAWQAADGSTAWTSDRFLYRRLTAPLGTGKTFVVGDVEGWVHWLSRDKGEPVLRMPTDGSAIRATPAAAGLTLLVATSGGGLFAFRPE